MTDREKAARQRRYKKDPSWITKPLYGYEFARRMGVNETTVKRWEKTGVVGAEHAPKVSAALGIPVEEITPARRRSTEEEVLSRLESLEATVVKVSVLDQALAPLREAILLVASGKTQAARRLLSDGGNT